MKKRNLKYEKKFRTYLFNFSLDEHKEICKEINVKPNLNEVFCCELCGCAVKEGDFENNNGVITHIDSCCSYDKDNNSDDKPNYEEAYNILMDYWDSLPDEEKPKIDKALKEVGC